jgi:hypothetical protein
MALGLWFRNYKYIKKLKHIKIKLDNITIKY